MPRHLILSKIRANEAYLRDVSHALRALEERLYTDEPIDSRDLVTLWAQLEYSCHFPEEEES